MIRFYTRIFSFILFCTLSWSELIAQPWSYDFGTGTGTANNMNSGSGNTSFFTSTPSGGGTYRVRIGGGGGTLALANPGTTLGTGTEVQLTASSSAASNKFSVYGWNPDSNLAYVKFNLRTTASGAADFLIGLGSSTGTNNGFNDNNSFSNTYNHSVATINLRYSSGNLTTIQRRNAGNWVAISTVSSVNFSKNSDQLIEIYANNSASSTAYNRSGSNTLNSQSWDLWIDGVKMSPSGGWGRAGTLSAGKINAFGFFGESSTSTNNNGILYLDNLEYSNKLPTGCAAPDETPAGFEYSTATENSIELEWLDGDGDGRVIIMNVSDNFTAPEDGTSPVGSTVYSGFGQQVVYNGTGSNSVVITGLLPNTTYYFRGYEYCTPDTVYTEGVSESVTTDIGSTVILTDQTGFGPFCNGTSHSINVGFDETGTFNEDFKVQISNPSGAFSSNLNDNIIGTGSSSPISATIPVDFSTGSGYRVRVVNADPVTVGDDNGSNIIVIVTPTTPAAATPAAVCEGISVNITAAGSANATGYTFWDAASGGSQITIGVSGNTLTTPNNLTPGNYSYFIQAENSSCSSINRQEVVVTINTVPALPSGSYTYSANPSCGPAAIGYDTGYYFQTSALGTSTANPTSSSYGLSSSGTVHVRAYNGSCWSDAVTSNAVAVSNPITVTTQPANVSVAENGSGSISVVATNVSTYSWQENDGSGWEDISGATTSVLVFSNPAPSQNGYTYRVVMTGDEPCDSVISSVVTLTVTAPLAGDIWSNLITGSNPGQSNPYTTGQTKNANITVSGIGRSTSPGVSGTNANDRYNTNGWNVSSIDVDRYITWTITANPTYVLSVTTLDMNLRRSATGPNKLQLRTSLDGFASGTEINYTSTANDVPFSFPINASDVTEIEVRLYAYGTDNSGGTFSVNDFEFTGIVKPACSVADPTGSFSYSANPSCGPATISYTVGYYFQTSETGTSISAPTSSAYTLNSSGTVYVRAYNGSCWSDAVASNAVVINSPISVSNQPQNRLVSSSGNATMSITASNVQAYQWQENDGSGWNNISGATTSSLVFNNPDQSKSGYTYRVVMTPNLPCGSVTSSVATLTVVTPSGPCSAPSGLSTNVAGGQVTFNWTGTEGADIHAILLTDVSTNSYSKGFSPIASGFTATILPGTYKWKIVSLCNTAIFVTENTSQWISGTQFTIP